MKNSHFPSRVACAPTCGEAGLNGAAHATRGERTHREEYSTLPMNALQETEWFAEQVLPHEPLLRAYLQRQFPALDDVDDIVQESHFRLLRARAHSEIDSAKSYLFAIARNIAIDITRRNRRVSPVRVSELPVSRTVDESADAGEVASIRQEVRLAAEAIDALPPRCREIVALRGVQGLSYPHIAQRLGISEQTVRVQMARGMKRCAIFLRERGVNGYSGV
jgi:RNA polymerase sigma factor (sigma-70 family)